MRNEQDALSLVRASLKEDEVVRQSLFGTVHLPFMSARKKRKGLLVATNQRLAFYTQQFGSETFEPYAYDEIDAVETRHHYAYGQQVVVQQDGQEQILSDIESSTIFDCVHFIQQKI